MEPPAPVETNFSGPPGSPNPPTGTITVHGAGKVANQVWTIKAQLSETELLATNACSNLLLTRSGQLDDESALEIVELKLADQSNQVIDLDKFMQQEGCVGNPMNTWVVNSAGDTFKGTGDLDHWYKIRGGLKNVTVGGDYVMGTSADGKIFRCKRPCNPKSQWEQVSGGLNQLDFDSSRIVGVNNNGEIWRTKTVDDVTSTNPQWEQIGNTASQVVVTKAHTYTINSDNHNIWYCPNPCSNNWKLLPKVKVPGSIAPQQLTAKVIAVADATGNLPATYWIVAADGSDHIMKGTIKGDGTFGAPKHVEGLLSYVSMDNAYVYGVNAGGEIYRCARPCNGPWQKVHGAATQISSYSN